MLDIESFAFRQFPEARISGDEIQVNCPNCEDNKQHYNINRSRQVTHCFKCGFSPNWIGLVMYWTNLPYWSAVSELYHKPRVIEFNKMMGEETKLWKVASVISLPDGFRNLITVNTKVAAKMRNYILSRGFSSWHIQRYNIGITDSIPLRIIIPIEFNYWQGRRLYDFMEPKYLNPPDPARNALFNSVALTLYEEVVICEGAFSAMAVGENAVALMGKECPDEKLVRLLNSDVRRFIVALDSDAKNQAINLCWILQGGGKEVELWDFHSGDPADNDGTVTKKPFTFRTKIEEELYGSRKR